MGIEEFKKTSIRSLFISFLTLIFIILFVKNETDTLLYICIQSGGVLLSQLIMWPFLKGKIKFILPKLNEVVSHLNGVIQFFIPQIAILFYTNLNKTALGVLDTKEGVAFYSNSMVIISVAMSLISTVDTVLLPNLSHLHAKGDTKGILKVLSKSLNLQLFFSIPAAVGIMLVSEKLVPWFFGEAFQPMIIIMPLLALRVIINPMGTSISRQYLIPFGKMKEYNISVFIGAIMGLISNFTLIPFIGVYGAVAASLLSEFFVTFTRTRSFIKETGFNYEIKRFIIYMLSSGFMYWFVKSLTFKLEATLMTTAIQIFLGILIYFFITAILKVNPLILIIKKRKKAMS